jgi:hypothetical protein
MMDILSLFIGFGIGVVVVAIAIEFGTKKSTKLTPSSRRTTDWSLQEIKNPKIMAEYLGDIEIPRSSQVLVNKYKTGRDFNGSFAKKNSGIRGNYILGEDRALILSGPVKHDEIGFWTVEKEIVDQLHSEFDYHWNKAYDIPKEKQ